MELFQRGEGSRDPSDAHGFFSPAGRALGRLVGPRVKWLVVLMAVVGSGLVLAFGGAAEAASTTATSLPAGAESARVAALRASVPDSATAPALAVFTRGGELSEADRAAVTAAQRRVVAQDPQRGGPPAQVADDGAAALLVVPLPSDLSATRSPPPSTSCAPPCARTCRPACASR